MIITLHDGFLLRWAWGPRRVTSNTRYGKLDSAYPTSITAGLGLWMQWFRRGSRDWLLQRWTIVVPPSKANARIQNALKTSISNEELPTESIDIAALTAERAKLRAEKRFTEADAIRDKLIAAGVEVSDSSVNVRSKP